MLQEWPFPKPTKQPLLPAWSPSEASHCSYHKEIKSLTNKAFTFWLRLPHQLFCSTPSQSVSVLSSPQTSELLFVLKPSSQGVLGPRNGFSPTLSFFCFSSSLPQWCSPWLLWPGQLPLLNAVSALCPSSLWHFVTTLQNNCLVSASSTRIWTSWGHEVSLPCFLCYPECLTCHLAHGEWWLNIS